MKNTKKGLAPVTHGIVLGAVIASLRVIQSFRFHVEGWDFYHNNTFLQTQHYVCIG